MRCWLVVGVTWSMLLVCGCGDSNSSDATKESGTSKNASADISADGSTSSTRNQSKEKNATGTHQAAADNSTTTNQAPKEETSPAIPGQAHPRHYNRVVALCIGIDRYRSAGIGELKNAERDAKRLASVLSSTYGYEVDKLLGPDATREAILNKIKKYLNELGKDDAFILHFAGHGQVIELPQVKEPDYGRRGYLVPYDAAISDLTGGSWTEWEETAINMSRLVEMIQETRAHHVVMIADCCCSGFMTNRGSFGGRTDLARLLVNPSRTVVSATTDTGGAGDGVFTQLLCNELTTRDARSLLEVFSAVRSKAVAAQPNRIPQLARVAGSDGEFVFIPLAIERGDVRMAMNQIGKKVAEQITNRTTLKDFCEVEDTLDYRYAKDRLELEKVWARRFSRYQIKAAFNGPFDLAALYYCYARGLGTEADEEKAFRSARRAFETGHDVGAYVYAQALTNGIGVEQNPIAAEEILTPTNFALVDAWRARETFSKSRWPPKDDELQQALAAFKRAANAGSTTAKVVLSRILLPTELGRTTDAGAEAEGLGYLKDACSDGLPEAHYIAYRHYMWGSQSRDVDLALRHLVSAAEGGYAEAQFRLACAYYPTPKMYVSRFETSRLALDSDPTESFKWATLASNQDNTLALVLLAHLHESGEIGERNFDLARQYNERAVSLGSGGAHKQRGDWWREGSVFGQVSDENAFNEYRKGAQRGDPDALFDLLRRTSYSRPEEVEVMVRADAEARQLGFVDGHDEVRARLRKMRGFLQDGGIVQTLRQKSPNLADDLEEILGPDDDDE